MKAGVWFVAVMMALTVALRSGVGRADGRPVRVALVVGNNLGDANDEPLRYAENDAERMSTVLVRLGGFAEENTLLLNAQTADDVRRAFATVERRLRGVPGDHVFFLYYSGHADGQALHLGKGTLALAELKARALELPVAVRIMIVDACQSGVLTRTKGGQAAPAFEIGLTEQPPRGMAILASSRGSEFAQESDELHSSFFTHHLLAGLLGMADRDHDGRVTLGESFDYASERTLDGTVRTWAGPQHPTFRYDLSGQSDLVLTHPGTPGTGHGWLTFDQAGWYFVRRRHGPIFAETMSRGGEQMTLEQGSYELSRRERDHLEVAEFEMAPGARIPASTLSTSKVGFGRVVRKGDGLRARAYAVSANGIVRGSLASLGSAAGIGVTARIDWATGSLEVRGAVAQTLASTLVPSQTSDMMVALAALRAWDVGAFTVAGGIEGGWSIFRQQIGDQPDRIIHAPVFGPTAIIELPLAARLCLRGDISLPSYVLTIKTETGERVAWQAALRGGMGAGGYF
jgi:hypothetical protein